jgi:hypothetical protein
MLSQHSKTLACLSKLKELPKQPNLREILKTSLIILITAETVDLIFYKQAFYLSIPLALLAGAFTVVAPEAYRKDERSKNQVKVPFYAVSNVVGINDNNPKNPQP